MCFSYRCKEETTRVCSSEELRISHEELLHNVLRMSYLRVTRGQSLFVSLPFPSWGRTSLFLCVDLEEGCICRELPGLEDKMTNDVTQAIIYSHIPALVTFRTHQTRYLSHLDDKKCFLHQSTLACHWSHLLALVGVTTPPRKRKCFSNCGLLATCRNELTVSTKVAL